MIQLAYVSTATTLLPGTELVTLLQDARDRNAARDVTGMLLYKDGSFLQVLEGDAESVHDIYRRIQKDPRHKHIRTLFDAAVARRDFPDWSMGFQNLDGVELTHIAGYNSFMDKSAAARAFFEDPTRAKKLLLKFRSTS